MYTYVLAMYSSLLYLQKCKGSLRTDREVKAVFPVHTDVKFWVTEEVSENHTYYTNFISSFDV